MTVSQWLWLRDLSGSVIEVSHRDARCLLLLRSPRLLLGTFSKRSLKDPSLRPAKMDANSS